MVEQLAPEDLVDEWSELSTSDLGPGARLGRYELLLPVAMGGMARVWAARLQGQRGFSKLVAIKTILPHLARDPEFERMFLDEARIASGVHHPNVCEIYELGEEGRALYLVMEWVYGESLIHILRCGKRTSAPIDLRVAARICADACAGLHAAHNLTDDDGRPLHVVHRDVSPHNLLVSIEGNVKVADFGVAKAYGQSHQATVAGQIKGKVAYMAPEQITSTAVDRRSDLYAMGCVLYEATTGALPFPGDHDPQIMQAVIKGKYALPSKLVPGFPSGLEAIITKALAPNPFARFGDAERMRVAIEEWLQKSGPLVTPSHVAAVVKQRVGADIERRREHVKRASSKEEKDGSWPDRAGGGAAPTGNTPSAARKVPLPGQPSKSGVVPAAQSVPPPRATMPAVRSTAPSQPFAQPALAAVPQQSAFPPPAAGVGGFGVPPAVGGFGVPPAPLADAALVSPHSFGKMAYAPPSSQPGASTPRAGYWLAAVIGLAAAGTLVGVGLIAFRAVSNAGTGAAVERAAATAPVVAPALPPPAESTAVSPPPTTAIAPASAAPVAVAPAPDVRFDVAPPEATLVVDGQPRAASVRALHRPTSGEVLVVVRAAGYVDETVRVTHDAPLEPIPVILVPTSAPPSPAPVATLAAPAPRPPPATKPTGGDLPPNPYDKP